MAPVNRRPAWDLLLALLDVLTVQHFVGAVALDNSPAGGMVMRQLAPTRSHGGRAKHAIDDRRLAQVQLMLKQRAQ
jgi:hypothetical protein